MFGSFWLHHNLQGPFKTNSAHDWFIECDLCDRNTQYIINTSLHSDWKVEYSTSILAPAKQQRGGVPAELAAAGEKRFFSSP